MPKPPSPPAPPGGKSLGAAKAEDGEVFSLFESDEKVDKEKLSAAVKPIADRLATELRRSFDYFIGQLGGGEIKKVTLSGGGAALKGLAEYLTTQLNVPVVTFDPLKKVTVPQNLPAQTNVMGFSAVLGMGMRMLDGTPLDIDMLPENIMAVRRVKSLGKDLKLFGAAAALLLGLAGTWAFMTVHNTKVLLEKIQSDITELAPVVDRVRKLEKDQKVVDDLEKSINALISSRGNWVDVLVAVDKTVPEYASVRSMSMPAKERMELQIICNSLAEVPELGKRFQTPDLTKGLFSMTNRPNPRKAEGTLFVVDFILKVNHAAVKKGGGGAGT